MFHRVIINSHMTRFQGCSAALFVLVLACSSSDDNFFKQPGDEAGVGGTGTLNVDVGGVGTSTVGGVDGSPASTTSSGGVASSDETTTTDSGASSGGGDGQGSGGDSGMTTDGATTTDGNGSTGGTGGGGSGGVANTGGTAGSGGGSGGDAASTGGAGGVGGSGSGGGGAGGSGGCSPSEEVCDGLDNDCNDEVDEGNVCPTGCFGDTYRGHAYLFCDRPPGQIGVSTRPQRNWQEAMQFCLNHDMVLVSMQTSAEAEFVYAGLDELTGSGDIWMGATDQDDEDLWSWALGMSPSSWVPFYDDNEEMALDNLFIDWRSGEPNDQGGEDCGVIEVEDAGGYLWDDRACLTDFGRFVCEDPPDG